MQFCLTNIFTCLTKLIEYAHLAIHTISTKIKDWSTTWTTFMIIYTIEITTLQETTEQNVNMCYALLVIWMSRKCLRNTYFDLVLLWENKTKPGTSTTPTYIVGGFITYCLVTYGAMNLELLWYHFIFVLNQLMCDSCPGYVIRMICLWQNMFT